MSKNAVIRRPKIETYRGEAGPCGVEVHTRRYDGGKLDNGLGRIAIDLRGGLGDPGSISLEDSAQELYEIGKGEFVVSTIGTNYPKRRVLGLVRGLGNAREARSKTAYKGMAYVRKRYQPRISLEVGQSEGGITMLDGTRHWVKKSKTGLFVPQKTGVITLNSPLRHEVRPEDPSVPEALMQLGAHCVPDLVAMSPRQHLAMVSAEIRHRPSLWDLAYMIAETGYLSRDYDMEPIVEELGREGIPVYHGVHLGDWVTNTHTPLGDTREFQGGHVRFAREPQPVVEYIDEVARGLDAQIMTMTDDILLQAG